MEGKLWNGHLYLSHTSEITVKLLYKKFYRNTDCTVLYGKWNVVLKEQQRKYLELSSPAAHIHISPSSSEHKVTSPAEVFKKKHSRRGSKDTPESKEHFKTHLRRLSDPSPSLADADLSDLPVIVEEDSPSIPRRKGISMETMDDPPSPTLIPRAYRLGAPLSPILLSDRSRASTLGRNNYLKTNRYNFPHAHKRLSEQKPEVDTTVIPTISSSRHGKISPRDIDPIQCLILFYASCWCIPPKDARKLKKIFGDEFVPKIEAHIRDVFNGEQCPGTSFVMETHSFPCQYVVCTNVARDTVLLSHDYAYNAFRSSLHAIHRFNKSNKDTPIKSILCPAIEVITSNPYNVVQQMETCYKYWDWHIYAPGTTVLPLVRAEREFINKEIGLTAPSVPKMAEDLEQYIWAGTLVARGLVYEAELQILLWWMEKSDKTANKKLPGVHRSSIQRYQIAQVLVDILKKPDIPPFTLTPSQIYSGITGGSLEYILDLAVEGQIKIYDDIKPEELIMRETLAHGTSGKVAKAEWRGGLVAVKFFLSYQPQVFRNELTLITLARHPKLVAAYGGRCTEKSTYIVSELMEMNLYQLLIVRPELDFITKLKIALDIAEAMDFLHTRGIVHRDLKSVNVLINCKPEIEAKVCDFGLSRVVDDKMTMTGNIGTVAWIAPEIFQNKKYTEKCDVYSFGIVLYELITHQLPFKDMVSFKIPPAVIKGQRPPIPDHLVNAIPKDYMALMKQCWSESASKRPSFPHIILRLSTLLSADGPSCSFSLSNVTSEESITETNEFSDADEFENTSSSSSWSFADQDLMLLDELRSMIGKRRHSRLVTDELLAKALLARRGKVARAKKLVKCYLEWYQIIASGKKICISDVRHTLEQNVFILPAGATDKDGRILLFWDASKYNVDVIPEPDLIRNLVYCLERATERPELHAKGIVIVGNFTGWTMGNFSTRVMNSFFKTLRKYFPLVLHRLYFVNPPPWISRVITMCQSFISSIMSAIEITTAVKLQEYISPENLLPCLGGTLLFDTESWIRMRHEVEGIEYLHQ